MSSPFVPWQRLLRVEILQLHSLKPSIHRFPYRTPWTESESESYVTTDGQSASLSWNKAPIWGLRQDFYWRRICRLQLLLTLASAVIIGRGLVEIATIFCCLRFETSLFVASYDLTRSLNWLCPLLMTSRHRPHREHISSIVVPGRVAAEKFTVPLRSNGRGAYHRKHRSYIVAFVYVADVT
jgi:hypothetical protein